MSSAFKLKNGSALLILCLQAEDSDLLDLCQTLDEIHQDKEYPPYFVNQDIKDLIRAGMRAQLQNS